MRIHLACSRWRSPRKGAAGHICSASCRVRGAAGSCLPWAAPAAGKARGRHSTRTLPARPLFMGTARHGHKHGHGSAHWEGKALLLGAARFSLLWHLQAENPMPGSGGWCFLSQHSQLLHAVLGKNLGWCPRKCKFYHCFWQAGI